MKRRDFLQSGAAFGAAFAGTSLAGFAVPPEAEAVDTGGGIGIMEGLDIIRRGRERNTMIGIRPEIADNPRAVFLVETHVSASRDGRGFFEGAQEQLFQTGRDVVPQIFIKGSRKGGSTLIRPNFTTVHDEVASRVTGVITSPDFIAGFVTGLRDLDNSNTIVSSRGGSVRSHRVTGIYDAFDAHGIDLIEAKYRSWRDYGKREVNWRDVPDPVVWKRFPVIRPAGDEDTFFINMPKLKSHNLGLTTLSVKNLQGVVPTGYGQFCTRWESLEYLCKESWGIDFNRHFVRDYYQNIESSFLRHRAAGYRHWDHEGCYPAYEKQGGWETFRKIKDDPGAVRDFVRDIPGPLMWDEMWCQRALDAASAVTPDINIIEGVIGRDGSGFRLGTDQLVNYLVIGLSAFEVDTVGSYIMGHDPRELYYTRMAGERALGECDPGRIEINLIRNGEIEPLGSLADIRRVPLGVNLHARQDIGGLLFW